MKKIIVTSTLALLLACSSNTEQSTNANPAEPVATTGETWNGYSKISPVSIPGNVIELISKEWMLITSGTEASFNTMTASWGGLGEMWGHDVAFMAVHSSRYTYQFLQQNEHYTLSFFDESYKNILNLLGTKSGRDGDKVAEAGLTPLATPTGSMSFSEARMIIECRKLYAAPYQPEFFIDQEVLNKWYPNPEKGIHTFYIGAIENVWIK